MQRHLSGRDEYLAGLWKRQPPEQLLWAVRGDWQDHVPDVYYTPSCSWAALDGIVHSFSPHTEAMRTRSQRTSHPREDSTTEPAVPPERKRRHEEAAQRFCLPTVARTYGEDLALWGLVLTRTGAAQGRYRRCGRSHVTMSWALAHFMEQTSNVRLGREENEKGKLGDYRIQII